MYSCIAYQFTPFKFVNQTVHKERTSPSVIFMAFDAYVYRVYNLSVTTMQPCQEGAQVFGVHHLPHLNSWRCFGRNNMVIKLPVKWSAKLPEHRTVTSNWGHARPVHISFFAESVQIASCAGHICVKLYAQFDWFGLYKWTSGGTSLTACCIFIKDMMPIGASMAQQLRLNCFNFPGLCHNRSGTATPLHPGRTGEKEKDQTWSPWNYCGSLTRQSR